MLNEHLPLLTIAALGALGGAIVLLLPDTAKPSKELQSPVGKKMYVMRYLTYYPRNI